MTTLLILLYFIPAIVLLILTSLSVLRKTVADWLTVEDWNGILTLTAIAMVPIWNLYVLIRITYENMEPFIQEKLNTVLHKEDK